MKAVAFGKRAVRFGEQARSGLNETSPAIMAGEYRNWIKKKGARRARAQKLLIFMFYLSATPKCSKYNTLSVLACSLVKWCCCDSNGAVPSKNDSYY